MMDIDPDRDHDASTRRDWLLLLRARNDQLERAQARIRELEDEIRELRSETATASQQP